MQLSDFDAYNTAQDKLYQLHAREKALEADRNGLQSQLLDARSGNPHDELIDELIENPEQVLPPAAVQALQTRHERAGREWRLVRKAITRQAQNVQAAEGVASRHACDEVRPAYAALVKLAVQRAVELAITCEQAQALTDDLRQGGLSAAYLPVIGLSRLTGGFNDRYSPLRQLMREALHDGYLSPEENAAILKQAVAAGYIVGSQAREIAP